MTRRLVTLSEIAIFTATALILDRLILFTLPQGGSVTIGMLPILLLAHRRGWRAGLLTGGLTGILQLTFGGYFLNLWQVLLDYGLAYTLLGLAGLVIAEQDSSFWKMVIRDWFAIGLRLTCHILAGILFYGQFAPAGTPVALYSFIYNASFIIPSGLLSLSLLYLIYQKKPDFLKP